MEECDCEDTKYCLDKLALRRQQPIDNNTNNTNSGHLVNWLLVDSVTPTTATHSRVENDRRGSLLSATIDAADFTMLSVKVLGRGWRRGNNVYSSARNSPPHTCFLGRFITAEKPWTKRSLSHSKSDVPDHDQLTAAAMRDRFMGPAGGLVPIADLSTSRFSTGRAKGSLTVALHA